MASFKLLMLTINKLETIKGGKPNLPKPPIHEMQVMEQTVSWQVNIFVQEVPAMPFHNYLASQILAKQLIKLGFQIWVKPTPIFETKLNIPKIQNKITLSFIILLVATLIIFIIFG